MELGTCVVARAWWLVITASWRCSSIQALFLSAVKTLDLLKGLLYTFFHRWCPEATAPRELKFPFLFPLVYPSCFFVVLLNGKPIRGFDEYDAEPLA